MTNIARDPASTNYAMDRVLWAFRNGVFFAASILTVLATASTNKHRQAGSTGPLANSAKDQNGDALLVSPPGGTL